MTPLQTATKRPDGSAPSGRPPIAVTTLPTSQTQHYPWLAEAEAQPLSELPPLVSAAMADFSAPPSTPAPAPSPLPQQQSDRETPPSARPQPETADTTPSPALQPTQPEQLIESKFQPTLFDSSLPPLSPAAAADDTRLPEIPLERLDIDEDKPMAALRSADPAAEPPSPIATPFEAPERNMQPEQEPSAPTPGQHSVQTDRELIAALHPIIEDSLQKALYAPETGIHTYLEPMLRNTVRRAIAEQMESSSQFHQVSSVDRLAWRLKALLSSRSYEEILFENTRRYQVEEVFLLRRDTLDLLSYASSDPVRHASLRRVVSTVENLRREICDAEQRVVASDFTLPGGRNGLVREGEHTFLLAIMRGASNALVRSDLDYLLHQVEQRFGERLFSAEAPFLTLLQPMLEAGLLIQAPAAPH